MSDNEWRIKGEPRNKKNSNTGYQKTSNYYQSNGYQNTSNYHNPNGNGYQKSNNKKSFVSQPKAPKLKKILKEAYDKQMLIETIQNIIQTQSSKHQPIDILASFIKMFNDIEINNEKVTDTKTFTVNDEYILKIFDCFKGKVSDNSRTWNGYGIFNILAYMEFKKSNDLSYEQNLEKDTHNIRLIFNALHSIGLNVFTVTGIKKAVSKFNQEEKPEDGIHSMYYRPNGDYNECPSTVKEQRMRIFYKPIRSTLDLGIRSLLSRFSKVDGFILDGFRYFLHNDYKITLNVLIKSIFAMKYSKLIMMPEILLLYCNLLLKSLEILNNKRANGDEAFEQFFKELDQQLDSQQVLNYFVETLVTESQIKNINTTDDDLIRQEGLVGFVLGKIYNVCNLESQKIIVDYIVLNTRASISSCYNNKDLFNKIKENNKWADIYNSPVVQTTTALKYVLMDLFDKYKTEVPKINNSNVIINTNKYIKEKICSKFVLELMIDNFNEDYLDMDDNERGIELGIFVVEFLARSPNNEYIEYFFNSLAECINKYSSMIDEHIVSQLDYLREENCNIDKIWNHLKNLFKK